MEMTSKRRAILLSCALHLVLRTTFFIHQSRDVHLNTPTVAAYIVYVSLMELIEANELITADLNPAWIKFAVEVLLIVWLGEVCLLLVWSNVEHSIVGLLSLFLSEDGKLITFSVYFLLLLLSLSVFGAVGFATKRWSKLQLLYMQYRLTENNIEQCFEQAKVEQTTLERERLANFINEWRRKNRTVKWNIDLK